MPLDAEKERLKTLKGQVLQLLGEAKKLEDPAKRKEVDEKIEKLLAEVEIREEKVDDAAKDKKPGEEVPKGIRQLASESSINNLSERCSALEKKLDALLANQPFKKITFGW